MSETVGDRVRREVMRNIPDDPDEPPFLVSVVDTFLFSRRLEQLGKCSHENNYFDRTLCGLCDSMHTYCGDCGDLLDGCEAT